MQKNIEFSTIKIKNRPGWLLFCRLSILNASPKEADFCQPLGVLICVWVVFHCYDFLNKDNNSGNIACTFKILSAGHVWWRRNIRSTKLDGVDVAPEKITKLTLVSEVKVRLKVKFKTKTKVKVMVVKREILVQLDWRVNAAHGMVMMT